MTMIIDPTTPNNNENTIEETLLYQSKHIKSFSFNNEPERTTCQEFRITTRAIHIITMDHTGASSSQINSTIPPIPFDKISMHAVNTPTDNDDDVDDDGNASQQRQLLPYVYCHISDFVKLAQNTRNQHMTDDDDEEEEENDDDDDDSFEELVITFAHPLSEEEIEQVFEAMNKGAELVPYVEESDMMNTNTDNDEWIYNREEVRKNIHLHERDDDSVSFLDAPKNDSAKIPRTSTTEE